MPIKIIENYEISIRPCEFNNFARIFGFDYNISTNYTDYKELMQFIFKTGITLDEFVSVPQDYYERIRKKVILKSKTH